MTTHYIATLGLKKCREIQIGDLVVPKDKSKIITLRVTALHADYMQAGERELNYEHWELADDHTDDFTHLANHISPNTKVVG